MIRLVLLGLAAMLVSAPAAGHEQGAAHPEIAAPLAPSETAAIDMPNSGAQAAQPLFLSGMVALHNFAFGSAIVAFQAAQAIDPAFALAYWGEAMAHAHFVWGDEDPEAGRRVLERAEAALASRPPTARDDAYLEAAEALFGDGDRETRSAAFEARMLAIRQTYPDDREAAVFHALALIRRGPQGAPAPVEERMRAAAILEPLFDEAPRHPGVLHHLIHAYDDPQHAWLALPAARLYEDVAQLHPHALHMPSHIYLRLGLWDNAARANAGAYAASLDAGHGAPDQHALEWLHFARLQQGRLNDAATLLEAMQALAEGDPHAARAAMRMQARGAFAGDAEDKASLPEPKPYLDLFLSYPNALFTAAIGAAERGDGESARQAVGRLEALRRPALDAGLDLWAARIETMADAARAVMAWHEGDHDHARALFMEALQADARDDRDDADQSLPNPVRPVGELFGDMLLASGDAEGAQAQFEAVLERHARRPVALLGLARALEARGETQAAACRYAELAAIWREADDDVPGLSEARIAAGNARSDCVPEE